MKHFRVLELVVRERLAEQVRRGPLPVHEALDFAKQIAEALEVRRRSYMELLSGFDSQDETRILRTAPYLSTVRRHASYWRRSSNKGFSAPRSVRTESASQGALSVPASVIPMFSAA